MVEPKVAQTAPYKEELEAGKKYFFCTCGESSKQPFCDGTHKLEGNFKSMPFEVGESKAYYLCGCKKSANLPFCDGTHKTC